MFDALAAKGAVTAWLPRLLELPERDGHHMRALPNVGELEESAWWPREKQLDPPRALLEHLLSDLAGSGRRTTVIERERLFAGDEQALKLAQAALNEQAGAGRAWYVFEGRTSVDAYIRTNHYVVLVEGKRTESGPTTQTSWMKVRHQVLRNIDAAWDNRAHRQVVAFFAVEGSEPDPTAVPDVWRNAVTATVSEAALSGSLPHRSPEVRQQMAGCFIGAVTWQAICREFGLPTETLIKEVPQVQQERRA